MADKLYVVYKSNGDKLKVNKHTLDHLSETNLSRKNPKEKQKEELKEEDNG